MLTEEDFTTVEEKQLAICARCRHYTITSPPYSDNDIHRKVLVIHECWFKFHQESTPQDGPKAEEIAQTVQVWYYYLNNFTLIERNPQFVIPENCPYILEHVVNEGTVKDGFIR